MKNKILIVDDTDFKSTFLTHYIQEHCGKCEIWYAVSYGQAMLNLNKKYDVVLVDHLLGNKNADLNGSKFALDYRSVWPDAIVLLYSAEPELAKDTVASGIKCFSFEAVQNEIYQALGDFNDQPKLSDTALGGSQMKTWIPVAGIALTLLAWAATSGKISNTVSTLKQNQCTHETNQRQREAKIDEFCMSQVEINTRLIVLLDEVNKKLAKMER